jgi:hypothetical protein
MAVIYRGFFAIPLNILKLEIRAELGFKKDNKLEFSGPLGDIVSQGKF